MKFRIAGKYPQYKEMVNYVAKEEGDPGNQHPAEENRMFFFTKNGNNYHKYPDIAMMYTEPL